MKFLISFFAIAFILMIQASCSRSNDDTGTNPNQQPISGTWRVSLFTDSGNDETTDFNGYVFSFNAGGVLSVVKNGVTKTGTWSRNTSSNKFNIDLGAKVTGNLPLGELTDDWEIISITASEIKLTDDNPASAEFLTFIKN